ncbi:hypothetical protein GCK72_000885 [Caenorhabditis remanei]|uniref:Secreted protein n=1 Tax=Caenorhabditis remanei TaxID=31234 RepID=A0A6A5HTF2_CAERE|nr:hypothetical protein GCK72_000885 [Caenorhabditis remanei]KAF1769072.1 hypothetical protein GCK72_000885 [Caenorhabditis remanei]
MFAVLLLALLALEPNIASPVVHPSVATTDCKVAEEKIREIVKQAIAVALEEIKLSDIVSGDALVEEEEVDTQDGEKIDRLELSFWKKLKHSIDKTLKKIEDGVVAGVIGTLTGSIVG